MAENTLRTSFQYHRHVALNGFKMARFKGEH